jgi:hypothetical protein
MKLLRAVLFVVELAMVPSLLVLALVARFASKKTDVGLGPEPLINNVYHKKALELLGYTAETFVCETYFITDDFDVRADKMFSSKNFLAKGLACLYLFAAAVFKYKCLYIYFNGGPLSFGTALLWRIEPLLYALANVKVVVMPYGGDVHDMSRAPNLVFKHAMSCDYPKHRFRRELVAAKIDLWTAHASHVISGCEWVYYMHHWDTLMLAHFSIDVSAWRPQDDSVDATQPLRILHAPNHRSIKGTTHFQRAVDELRDEGVPVELVLLEKVPNTEIKAAMSSVDVVADQLLIGWYAMFAIEAMAMGKPVLCHLRSDLVELYTIAGLVKPDEIPVINCNPLTVKAAIRALAKDRSRLKELGKRSREYVLKHHSVEVVGKVFEKINRSIGVAPSSPKN